MITVKMVMYIDFLGNPADLRTALSPKYMCVIILPSRMTTM